MANNQLSHGTVEFADFAQFANNKAVRSVTGSITRANTTATPIGDPIPAGSTLIALTVFGAAVSNAGTTATLSVGKSGGTGTEYLNAFDVKGSTGSGQQTPTAATNLGGSGANPVQVTCTYAETGTASGSGGPWQITLTYAPPN